MAGLAAGSLLVPALVALGGPRMACIALGALFASAAVLGGRRVLALDRRASVPIVEISLLRTLPIFAPLGTPTPLVRSRSCSAATTRSPSRTCVPVRAATARWA